MVRVAFLVDFCVYDVEYFLSFSEMLIAIQGAGTKAECLLRLGPYRSLLWSVSFKFMEK